MRDIFSNALLVELVICLVALLIHLINIDEGE